VRCKLNWTKSVPRSCADLGLALHRRWFIKNPERGTRVKGLGGIQKARAEDPRRGKGKRGGFRYMYYYIEPDKQIFLMAIFSKDEQEDLNKEQKKA
jgi:hypothetical protein